MVVGSQSSVKYLQKFVGPRLSVNTSSRCVCVCVGLQSVICLLSFLGGYEGWVG